MLLLSSTENYVGYDSVIYIQIARLYNCGLFHDAFNSFRSPLLPFILGLYSNDPKEILQFFKIFNLGVITFTYIATIFIIIKKYNNIIYTSFTVILIITLWKSINASYLMQSPDLLNILFVNLNFIGLYLYNKSKSIRDLILLSLLIGISIYCRKINYYWFIISFILILVVYTIDGKYKIKHTLIHFSIFIACLHITILPLMTSMKLIHNYFGLGISGKYAHYTSVCIQDENNQAVKTFYELPEVSTLGFNTVSHFGTLLKDTSSMIDKEQAKKMIQQSYLNPKKRSIHPDLFFGTREFSKITHLWDYNLIMNVIKFPRKQILKIESSLHEFFVIIKSIPLIIIILLAFSLFTFKNDKLPLFFLYIMFILLSLYSLIQIQERFFWCLVPVLIIVSVIGFHNFIHYSKIIHIKYKFLLYFPLVLILLYNIGSYFRLSEHHIRNLSFTYNNTINNEFNISQSIVRLSNSFNTPNIPLIGIGDYKQNLIGFFSDKLVISNNVNLDDFTTNLGHIKQDLREFILYTSNDYTLQSVLEILQKQNIVPIKSIRSNFDSNIIYCKT